MACARPIDAWQLVDGSIHFSDKHLGSAKPDGGIRRELKLACGQCMLCRISRQRAWAVRCMHEAQMHVFNCFVTLTYDEEHYGSSLDYSDFQLFIRYLRRDRRIFDVSTWQWTPRYFVCGEYGDQFGRRHFHALLFGYTFFDGVPCGKNIYSSKELSKLWPHGYSSFGSVTYESASYVAGYCCKKVKVSNRSPDDILSHYERLDLNSGEIVDVVPEFGKMSLKPGIGYSWFEKYWREVYLARDGVVLKGGATVPAPRYYDKLLLDMDSELYDVKTFDRYVRSRRFVEDSSPRRLLDRELCAKARFQSKRKAL